jgi:hypothetical protein
VHVVGVAVEFPQVGLEVPAHFPHYALAELQHVVAQHAVPVLGHED